MWTVHLRACMQDALQHNQRSLFRRWRIFAHVSQHKVGMLPLLLVCVRVRVCLLAFAALSIDHAHA